MNQLFYISYFQFYDKNIYNGKISTFYQPSYPKKEGQIYNDQKDVYNVYTLLLNISSFQKENILNTLKEYKIPLSKEKGVLVINENDVFKHIYIVDSININYANTIKITTQKVSLYKQFQKNTDIISALLKNIHFTSEIHNAIKKENLLFNIFYEELEKCSFILINNNNICYSSLCEFLKNHHFSFIKMKNFICIPEIIFYLFIKENTTPI